MSRFLVTTAGIGLMLALVPAATLAAGSAAHTGHGDHMAHDVHAGHAMPHSATDHGAAGHMAPARVSLLRIDELETVNGDAGRAVAWDGSISWGGPFDRVWLASEGERAQGGEIEQETSLFWSHAVSRWWDTTLGVRQDREDGERRNWVAAGVRGLAPYWFETEATAYVGTSGRSMLRLKGEYELLITNRLILQPQVELNVLGHDDEALRQGRGLSDSEWGLRLRYEIRREIAPYIGLVRQLKHGRTADLARAEGDQVGDTTVVAGLRLWY